MSSIAEEGWKGGNEITGPAGRGDGGLHSTPRGSIRQCRCHPGLLAMGSAQREDPRAQPPAPCAPGTLVASCAAPPDHERPPCCPAPGICPCTGSLRRSTAAQGTQKLAAAALLGPPSCRRLPGVTEGPAAVMRTGALGATLSFMQPSSGLGLPLLPPAQVPHTCLTTS